MGERSRSDRTAVLRSLWRGGVFLGAVAASAFSPIPSARAEIAEIACSEIELLSIEGSRGFEKCLRGTSQARDSNGSGRMINSTIEFVQGVDGEAPAFFLILRIETSHTGSMTKQNLRELVDSQFAAASRNWGPGNRHGAFETQELEARFGGDAQYFPCVAFIHHWRPEPATGAYRSILGGTYCAAPGRLTSGNVEGFLDSLRY